MDAELIREIVQRLARIEQKVDDYKENLREVKADITWLWRTIIATIIGVIASIIIGGLK